MVERRGKWSPIQSILYTRRLDHRLEKAFFCLLFFALFHSSYTNDYRNSLDRQRATTDNKFSQAKIIPQQRTFPSKDTRVGKHTHSHKQPTRGQQCTKPWTTCLRDPRVTFTHWAICSYTATVARHPLLTRAPVSHVNYFPSLYFYKAMKLIKYTIRDTYN